MRKGLIRLWVLCRASRILTALSRGLGVAEGFLTRVPDRDP